MHTREYLILEAAKRLGYDCSKLTTSTERKIIACRHGHGKRSPCCSISITKNLVHCFSCHESGKITTLFYEEFGHSISRELNINTEYDFTQSPFFQKYEPPDLETIPETDFSFSGSLISVDKHEPTISYLNRRGITLKVANDMGMKYAVRAKSILDSDAKEIIYFTDRLIIPIYEKKLLSVEGRDIYGENAHIEKMTKLGFNTDGYRKCLYPKGASLGTLFQFTKLKQDEVLFLTEGLIDLAVLRTDDMFKNSTTIFGASISQRQLYLLSKFKDVVYIHDLDLAGWRSVLKIFKYRNGDIRLLSPPPGCNDIGDIITELGSTITECINRKWLTRIYKPTEKLIQEKIDELIPIV